VHCTYTKLLSRIFFMHLNQQTNSHTAISVRVSEWHSGLYTKYGTCLRLSLDVGLRWTKTFSKLQSLTPLRELCFLDVKLPSFFYQPPMAQSSTQRHKEGSKDDSERCLLLVPVVFSYIKTLPTNLTLQSCEADLPNFAQDLKAVSSLSIRASSSLFYRFYLYQKGCVMVTLWGLYLDAT